MSVKPDTVTSATPTTMLSYRIEASSYVTVYILNNQNRVVLTVLENALLEPGVYGTDLNLDSMGSGVYYVLLNVRPESFPSSSGVTDIRSLVLLN